jgi:hypothetical protein
MGAPDNVIEKRLLALQFILGLAWLIVSWRYYNLMISPASYWSVAYAPTYMEATLEQGSMEPIR